jgi:biotin carboxyl carrier protein
VQFPVETVREVAQILNQSNLGEISLEDTASGARLRVKRTFVAAPGALPATEAEIEAQQEAQIEADIAEKEAESAARIEVLSPAVGVFRAAKVPLQIGDEVGKKALLGAVETLGIPTELYASQSARVIEILVSEGQAVEWGQTLLVLEPIEK